MKNYHTYQTNKQAKDYWGSHYGELVGLLEKIAKSPVEIGAFASNEKRWDEFFVADSYEIGGNDRRTFAVFSTLRNLTMAAFNPIYAAIDGTNRLNYPGKTLVLVHTVDAAQSGHVIGYFLLTKGECEEEILAGLRVLRAYIRAVHAAILELPLGTPSPYKRLRNPPAPDWVWRPTRTQNDGGKGLRKAWISFREIVEEA